MSRRQVTQNPKFDVRGFFTLLFADSSNESIEIRAIDGTRRAQIHFHSGLDDLIDDLTNPTKFPNWITIPAKDIHGDFVFFKLRQDPARGDKMTYPKGVQAQIYDWKTLQNVTDRIVVYKGELDRLVLMSKGIPVITPTHGVGTFRKEWVKHLQKWPKIYVDFDNGEVGEKDGNSVCPGKTCNGDR